MRFWWFARLVTCIVLDNGTDEVLDSEAVHDYRPILTFASNATCTHGYRLHQRCR